MQSSVPIPGNPWPHEMVIAVDSDPHALLELLWIRQAWGLQPVGDDLPPSLSDEIGDALPWTGDPERVSIWEAAWPSMWGACVRHAGIHDEAVFRDAMQSAAGSPEQARLFEQLRGPSWRDAFGDEALAERYQRWEISWFERQSGAHPRSLDEIPERASLRALIPAWRAGLTRVVTIPCVGSYTRVIGTNTLLVTEQTRDDANTYSAALRLFG